MKLSKQSFWKSVGYVLSGIGLLSILWAAPALHGAAPAQAPCHTETKKRLRNVSDLNFEITYTSCDILAKEAWISVYVSKAGVGEKSSKAKRSNENLLFRYDPGAWDAPLPKIESTGENKIVISISRVSEVLVQKRTWGGISVDYQIGQIDYPDAHESSQPH